MEKKDLLIVSGISLGAILIISRSKGHAEMPKQEQIKLSAVQGAQWTVPLYVTVERDINFSGIGAFFSSVGNIIGKGLSGINSIAKNIVMPAITKIGSGVATVIKMPISWIGKGVSKVGPSIFNAVKTAGSKAWEVVGGVVKSVVKPSGNGSPLITYSPSGGGSKPVQTVVTTQPPAPQSTTPSAPVAKTMLVGYLSSSNFPGALTVTSLYNPQAQDVFIATDPDTVKQAQNVGYVVKQNLGFCSPAPFLNSVPIISLYNQNLADHIITTSIDQAVDLEKLGYESWGCIGYCFGIVS